MNKRIDIGYMIRQDPKLHICFEMKSSDGYPHETIANIEQRLFLRFTNYILHIYRRVKVRLEKSMFKNGRFPN